MSNEQQNKVPMKGTIIINPKTSRPVKVGSRTWLKLVREGVVESHYKDDNEIYTLQDGDDVVSKIQEFNKTLPPNVQSVRGRGKYANKIVKRHRKPSTETTSRYTVKKTASKIKNREVYEELQEGGNFEEDLEALIMGELAGFGNDNYEYSAACNAACNAAKPQRTHQEYTIEEEHDEYEGASSDENEDDASDGLF